MGTPLIFYSLVIPVYNRPEELKLLLDSISFQVFERDFEVLVVEDGSLINAKHVCENSAIHSKIAYYQKSNSGPGLSRNYGMLRAKGDYFIILDSDCVLPANFLSEVDKELAENFVDFFGGPDSALESFSPLQKAVNIVMTSTLSTVGVRGGLPRYFEPRSFNMGLSKKVFEATNGFGAMHPGEDPDLVMRAWKMGFQSRLFPKAFVYHQRRIHLSSFFVQVFKFGSVRPILEVLHPEYKRLVFKGPSLFLIYIAAIVLSLPFALIGLLSLKLILLISMPFLVYMGLFKLQTLYKTHSIKLTSLAVMAFIIQMTGYGMGYMRSKIYLALFRNKPIEQLFPRFFFNPNGNEPS
jgi:glycosyltransferase involved in cell wall biosynthesis